MNKLISILLLETYSSSSFWVTINFHYCRGKFSGLALSNFGGAVQYVCNHTESTNKDCGSYKPICTKTDSHRVIQQYWISQGTLSFILPHYFEKKEALDYTNIEAINSNYSSSGFTGNHFSWLRFLLALTESNILSAHVPTYSFKNEIVTMLSWDPKV